MLRADCVCVWGGAVPIVMKSGSLNRVEPSGPVQACNGIAFNFYRIILQSVASLPVPHFSKLFHKPHDFWRTVA
jgi:hypothetical protein